jgi:colanic acid/amylovoran biosynthesis glycosyltransferase
MEAQAVGLPAVATRVGAADEVLSEGVSGLLAPPGDPEALADRLAGLIACPERWPEFGQAGRRHVAARFDINPLNDRLVALYQGLLEKA